MNQANEAGIHALATSFNLYAPLTDPQHAAAVLEVFTAFQHYSSFPTRLLLIGIDADDLPASAAAYLAQILALSARDARKAMVRLRRMVDLALWWDDTQTWQEGAMLPDVPWVARGALHQPMMQNRGLLLPATASAREFAAALAFLARMPDLRRRCRAEPERNAEPQWIIDGPFDSSYSLAIVNRELARALRRQQQNVVLIDPEITQGRAARPEFLAAHPELVVGDGASLPTASTIQLRNNYPPVVDDLRASISVLANYAWEESAFPAEYVAAFNRRLDLITVVSPWVKKILRDNGVQRPIAVVGNGVDHLGALPEATGSLPGKAFRFLHISSCFPRKGLDVLLAAYGRAFTVRDDVSLIIKTFPNPHNDAAQQIAASLRAQSDYPDVVLIDEDWPDARLAALYRHCHAFVLPTRAEGFGMPLAEAMTYRLPVITTGYGGQCYFCDEQTSWLVDYRFAKAATHLGLFDSAWVEPDVEHLAARLREVYSASPEQLAAKTTAAAQRVSQLTWDQVATTTRHAVARLARLPLLPPEPRIGWVSTWNCRCGIATYSKHLLCEIPPRRLRLFANEGVATLGDDEAWVERCWSSQRSEITRLCQAIRAAACQIVVIQHHPGLMALTTLAALIDTLADQGIHVYVTLHNTHPVNSPPQWSVLATSFNRARRLLVHSVSDLNRLKDYGMIEPACWFPHGVYPSLSSPDVSLATRMGLHGKIVIGSFGFIMPHKGLRELIEAFAEFRATRPASHLLLVNALFPEQKSLDERDACRALIERLGLRNDITLIDDFLDDHDALHLLSLCDVIVYPYQHSQESASGAVRMGLAAARPVAVTPLAIFDDVADVVHVLPGCQPHHLAAGLAALLTQLENAETAAVWAQRAAAWRAAHQWPLLSQRLLGLIDGAFLDDVWHAA